MNLQQAYNLFHKGLLALQRAERQGLRVNVEACHEAHKEVTKELESEIEKFQKTKLWKIWKDLYGHNSNIQSVEQLGRVLKHKLGEDHDHPKTSTGKFSTNEDALTKLDLPELNILLNTRKLRKLRDTYLKAYMTEQVNGKLHPFFNLHSVVTYRSSSSGPNFQNIPKRDKRAKEICRKVLFPRKGYQLMEVDYSGIEVRIAAVVTKDRKLKSDVLTGDMHKDMAIELFKLDSLDKHHEGEARLRHAAKNGFVFPQFYGDYYGNNVPILLDWAKDATLKSGITANEHLKRRLGVKYNKAGRPTNVRKFEEHVKAIEHSFWNQRYRTYNNWKDKTWNKFEREGCVSMVTGFKLHGDHERKKLLNALVQGPAFHCLLWSFVELDRIMRREKWRTRIVGQIHDAIILDVHPDELKHVATIVKRVMTEDLLKAWKWITVPLEVEIEVFGVDKSWLHGEAYEG